MDCNIGWSFGLVIWVIGLVGKMKEKDFGLIFGSEVARYICIVIFLGVKLYYLKVKKLGSYLDLDSGVAFRKKKKVLKKIQNIYQDINFLEFFRRI